jgi:hypothetical protein
LQYLDKNSINFSSVYGLQKGTHLKGQDYSWLGIYPSAFICSSIVPSITLKYKWLMATW